jgi:hypothetical protein
MNRGDLVSVRLKMSPHKVWLGVCLNPVHGVPLDAGVTEQRFTVLLSSGVTNCSVYHWSVEVLNETR